MTPTPPRRTAATAVHLNGYALAAIRQLQGVERADLVAALECTPGYLSKLETGRNRRCSPPFLSRLATELGVDRRALLACPHAPEDHGDTHLDDGGATAPMPRPVVDPAGPPAAVSAGARGRHRAARRASA